MTWLETCESAIKDCDVVSFDVFDTLLARNVAIPLDVFRVVQYECNELGSYYLGGDFAEMRTSSERKVSESEAGLYYSLNDIYDLMQRKYDLPTEITDYLQTLELDVERRLIVPRREGLKLFSEAIRAKKTVVLISDMYLPTPAVARLLEDNGVTGYDKLIVSADMKLSKADGSVYPWLLEKYGHKKYLHIGDNSWSDVTVPRKFGISTVQIPAAIEIYSQGSMFSSRRDPGDRFGVTLQEAIATSLNARLAAEFKLGLGSITREYLIGYRFGLVLLAFTYWLRFRIKQDKRDAVYFLARDGALMLQVFKLCFPDDEILSRSHYTFASRRLFNLAAISGDSLSAKDLDFLVGARSNSSTVEQVVTRFGFQISEFIPYLKEVGLEPTDVISGVEIEGKLRASLRLATPLILHRAESERTTLNRYFESVGIAKAKNPAVVDIGWQGSLQRSLRRLLGKDIGGYYFGKDERVVPAFFDMSGFVSQSRLDAPTLFDGEDFIVFMEQFFTNPDEDTILGIKEEDSSFAPVTLKLDYPGLADDRRKIRQLQSGALAFVKDYLKATAPLAGDLQVICGSFSWGWLTDMVDSPSEMVADVIGGLHQYNGFGSAGFQLKLVGKPSKIGRFSSRKRLAKEFKDTCWHQGFRVNVEQTGRAL